MVAKYVTTADSYLNEQIVKKGDTVEHAGWPGKNLKPANKEAEAVAARYAELKATPGADIPKSPADDGKPAPTSKPARAKK